MAINRINGYVQVVGNLFAWYSFGYQGQYFKLSAAKNFTVTRFVYVSSNRFPGQ